MPSLSLKSHTEPIKILRRLPRTGVILLLFTLLSSLLLIAWTLFGSHTAPEETAPPASGALPALRLSAEFTEWLDQKTAPQSGYDAGALPAGREDPFAGL